MKTFYSVLLCTLFTFGAYGQREKNTKKDSIHKKSIKLNEVIVTGNSTNDPVFVSVTNKFAEKIVQPKNIADLFQNINGFSVIKRGNYAIDPSFRASQYEQLNIQYDGGTKAMHACPNRMDPITTHIIPEEIAKIEIIKGPYTVRYGATFGGIINLVSKNTNYDEAGFHGKISSGYESNGNANVNMVELQYANKTIDIVTNMGYRNFGNYKDGFGTQIPSSFKSSDYGIKLGYNISNKQRLKVNWKQSFGRDVQHAALPMDTDFDNSSIFSLNYKIIEISENIKSLTAKGYYSFVDHLMTNTNRPSFNMTEAIAGVNATTSGGKIEVNWKPAPKINMFSGIDLINIARDGNRERIVKIKNGTVLPSPKIFNDKVWQDSYINDVGLFTESKFKPTPRLTITTGIRYNHIASNIKDPEADFAQRYDLNKRTEHTFGGTLSIKKTFKNNFSLEAAYGRGTRTANMIERYINHFTVGQDPYEYLGNPNLNAEINNQFEIGIKGTKDIKNGTYQFYYESSIYYSLFENYIVAVVDPNINRKFKPTLDPTHVKVFQNLKEAFKTGFELMLAFDFLKDFSLKTEFSYVYSENKDLNESLPLTPPFSTKLFFGYEKEKIWANAQYNLISKQDQISTSFGETTTKGYQTLDLRFGASPLKNTSLGFAVLNLFDQGYNNHLNFSFTNQENFGRTPITEPGRNFSVFLQYKF